MERVYLQWSLVNWITVVLMASVGAAILGIIVSGAQTYSAPELH